MEVLLGTRVEAVERPTRLVTTRKRGGSAGGEGAAALDGQLRAGHVGCWDRAGVPHRPGLR